MCLRELTIHQRSMMRTVPWCEMSFQALVDHLLSTYYPPDRMRNHPAFVELAKHFELPWDLRVSNAVWGSDSFRVIEWSILRRHFTDDLLAEAWELEKSVLSNTDRIEYVRAEVEEACDKPFMQAGAIRIDSTNGERAWIGVGCWIVEDKDDDEVEWFGLFRTPTEFQRSFRGNVYVTDPADVDALGNFVLGHWDWG